MYVEFKSGEKYSDNLADISDSHLCFHDAGYVLTKNDLVVDVDCLPKETIEKMIAMFHIKTQTVWTDRGAHFYFKKPESFTRGAEKICALGFKIELKHSKNTKAVTIKRNGVLRDIDNEGIREDFPLIFSLNKKFNSLLGLQDGEGRNSALFKHRNQLAGSTGWENMLRFINNYVFSEPMLEEEFQIIVRNMAVIADKDNEPEIAEYMMNEYRMTKHNSHIYFYQDGEYKCDDDLFKRLVFNKVGSQKTRYVDEVIRQIEYRCGITKDDKVFDIKLKNGILRKGQFIEIDYQDFTPFCIDIAYYSDAEPVEEVDEYIKHLTSGSENYKKLLFEVLGHTLIVNKEFKRLLAKFFIFVGGGGNGKGTLLQIIKQILGDRNCTGLSIKNMCDERYLVTMRGKLANLGDDIHDEPIDNEEMKQLKNITSCDYVAMRELYKQSSEGQLTVTLIFTSNHIIKSFEKGKSYKRRVLWLPMYTEVDESNKDSEFITKLTRTKALEYWIKLIVEGYFRLYKNKKFTSTDIVDKFNEEYHKENNSALLYLDDFTDEDILYKRNPEIMADYTIWAEENGLNVASAKMMKEAIWEKFKLGIGSKKINGKSAKVYLRQEDTSQDLMKE